MTGLVGPLRVTPRGELASASDTALWREHVRAVLLTQARWDHGDVPAAGERWMRETFGCRVHRLLHEPLTEETAALAESLLVEDLQHGLPHLTLTHIQTRLDEENGALHVTLGFTPPTGQAFSTRAQLGPRKIIMSY
ncbi:MAG: GPW/gp25 family protein [Myxococcota bacterium]